MSSIDIFTAIITAVTVFGSAGAWRYYEKKAMAKEKAENFVKDDCRERITKLESLLEKSSKEKDELRTSILDLTAKVSELNTKVEFLQKERNTLLHEKRERSTPIKRRPDKNK